MADATEASRLKRHWETMLAMDLSAMGYEARAYHQRRIERARQAYQQALEDEAESSVESVSAGLGD
ncbi:MAG: hypothetical protein ACE5HE_04605 [Phycisphaerae bacterium]